MFDKVPIDVQEIMLHIEQQIRAQRDSQDISWTPDLAPELRAHLIRLQELSSSLQVEPVIQPSSIPVIGRLIGWGRTQIHNLVLFYINSLIRQQISFEQALIRALIYLAEQTTAENKSLRDEVENLRYELAQARASSLEE